ncbi:MAG: hypothetical protein GXP63_02425 [DPANN group archaeon]|nr:hypothetical protein [DPANN group archaeon]
MALTKVYLFTSPTCPNCPAAKTFIREFRQERDDFQLIELSTMSHEGQRKAKSFNVMSVPTFIIKGPGYPQAIGLMGVQSSKSMNKYLDLSYGKELPEEPTFREKLRKGIKIGKLKIKL